MEKRYYLDTSIWRDYFENRRDSLRPIGEWAFMLINKILAEGDVILYTELTIFELKIKYTPHEIECIFSIAKQKGATLKVDITRKQKELARDIATERHVPVSDAMHALIARANNAIMVTRDKHFGKLADIAEVRKPEELL